MSSVCLAAGDVYVPVKIEENDLYTGVLKLLEVIKPNWTPNNITFKVNNYIINIYILFKINHIVHAYFTWHSQLFTLSKLLKE